MNIQHSSKTDEWYTPIAILDKARLVLGDIDLDPASDEFGNSRVRAKRYLTKAEDGLLTTWKASRATIFCNPPGGKRGNQSMTALFWKKLMAERESICDAIFLCFSLEAMQNTQDKGCMSVGEFPFCIPRKRIRFEQRSGVGPSPSHSNVIVYVPGIVNRQSEFRYTFNDLGVVRI